MRYHPKRSTSYLVAALMLLGLTAGAPASGLADTSDTSSPPTSSATEQTPTPEAPSPDQSPTAVTTEGTAMAAGTSEPTGGIPGLSAGSFTPAATGGAMYRIPIVVPPGTAGMQPNLGLVYNSQGPNGLLSHGWSLDGSPAITRCAATVAQDGFRGGIAFDANDRFCLLGQRLMVISGTYGADGAEYRTEVDSFVRVISYGVAGSGPPPSAPGRRPAR